MSWISFANRITIRAYDHVNLELLLHRLVGEVEKLDYGLNKS